MNEWRIPFNRPSLTGLESTYIARAVERGQISGDGPFSRKCQELLEKELGVNKVLLTTSCTHALEMAALLLDIRPGDEVIVPSFTFVSTANAFALRGARIVFGDIRRDTLNLDETRLEALITPRTKAIVVVHYAGVGCDMDAIQALAVQHGVPVVEDNAHGLFGKYRGQFLGTLGCLATLSFHETKNFSCGEGGALIINDPRYVERAEILREKGTNRRQFFMGQVDKYTWVDIGSSYVISDILAAFLYAQFEAKDAIVRARERIWTHYHRRLTEWAAAKGVAQPYVPPWCAQSHHMYYLIFPSMNSRQAMIEHLKRQDILSVFHYVPLHLSRMGRQFGGKEGDCPVTEDISQRLLRLPFYNSLTEADQERVVTAITAFEPLPERGGAR
jgi:dTDP-4-amino-4,6-dideoxygalactose transaminase